MSKHQQRDEHHAVREEWLPDRQPPAGAPIWDARLRRILAEVDPEMRRRTSRGTSGDVSWWTEIARWRNAAAAFAAAAAVALVLAELSRAPRSVPSDALLLDVVASDGDPAALWRAAGIPADPALALAALAGRQNEPSSGAERSARLENGQ